AAVAPRRRSGGRHVEQVQPAGGATFDAHPHPRSLALVEPRDRGLRRQGRQAAAGAAGRLAQPGGAAGGGRFLGRGRQGAGGMGAAVQQGGLGASAPVGGGGDAYHSRVPDSKGGIVGTSAWQASGRWYVARARDWAMLARRHWRVKARMWCWSRAAPRRWKPP